MKVRMEADAPGTGPAARAAAMQSAERQIIFEVLQVALATDNLDLLTKISDNAPKYVRSTQLIRYDTRDEKTHVEIESYVKRKELLRDAATVLLAQMASPPTVLVLMAEQLTPDKPLNAAQPGVAEKALIESLKDAHFEVVDSRVARACYSEADLPARIEGDTPAAAGIAQQAFGDVTVVGTVEMTATSNGNVFNNHAKLVARVFRGLDGKLIDALGSEAVVHSANPEEGATAAIEDACAKIAKDLALSVTLAATGPTAADELLISVENPGSRARFDAILANVRRQCPEGSAKELFYSDALARLRLKYDGPVAKLLDNIVASAYEGFSVEVHKAVQKNIVLRIVEPK